MIKKPTELSVLVEIRDFLKAGFLHEPVLKPEVFSNNGKYYESLHNPARFLKLPDGWIKDHLLGLDWGPSSTEAMDFEEAEKYVDMLGNRARFPEIWELETLCDRSRREPAIFSIFLNDTKFDDWYWTKTAVAGFPARVWCVGFNYGYVYNGSKDYHNYVRPVRSSQ